MAIPERVAKTLDVAVAGEIFADHIFSGFERWPQPGEEHFTDQYLREVGGGAAITACALARLGRKTAVFGVVGEQDVWLPQRLQEFGVHLHGLRTSKVATAVSVSISTRQDRSFFTWTGANRGLAPYLHEPATQKLLAQARHVHLAMPVARDLAHSLFPRLRANDCSISLDVGHHVEWLRDEANWRTCAEVDFFLPNEKEAQIITGIHQPRELLRELRARGLTSVVLKLGGMGAESILAEEIYRARAPAVDVVDTTGAGDAFDAGFLDACLDGADPISMLKRACFCGSMSTTKAGALNALPTKEELIAMYADPS